MEEEDGNRRLPEEILVSIVSRLTLGDAVRTSVLSKRWRYVWAHTIRALNFDASEIQSKHLLSSPSGDDYSSGQWGSADSYNYSEWVSGVLAQHRDRGPNVDEFRVCYDLDMRYASRIDGWIQFALSNRLHTLELTLSRKHLWKWLLAPHSYHSYHTYYTLQRPVWMSSGVFVGFKSLKSLSFNSVNVVDEVVEHLLSNCPLLERLSLLYIYTLRNLKVAGPTLLLSHLEVVACHDIKAIEIYDTNLVSFTIVGPYIIRWPEVIIKNSPQLVELYINNNGNIWWMLSDYSCIYSQLQILQLTFYYGEGDGGWEYPMPLLENLKQFVLVLDFVKGRYSSWVSHHDQGLAQFGKICIAVVHVLQIKFGRCGMDDIEGEATEVAMREKVTFCHPCLKVVEIAGYYHAYHLYLFKQIIKNAVALEKIIIDTRDPDPRPLPAHPVIYRELESGEEQQLRGFVPPGVKLVIL